MGPRSQLARILAESLVAQASLHGALTLGGVGASEHFHDHAQTFLKGVGLRRASKLLVLGPPGTGKTTLLRELSGRLAARYDFDDEATKCPVFLLARQYFSAPHDAGVVVTVDGHDWRLDAVIETLGEARCTLIVDGLDEVADSMAASLSLATLARRYHDLQVVVSCRPAALRAELQDFDVFKLSEQFLPRSPAWIAPRKEPAGEASAFERYPEGVNAAQGWADVIDARLSNPSLDLGLDLPGLGQRLAILSDIASFLYVSCFTSTVLDETFKRSSRYAVPSRADLETWFRRCGLVIIDGEGRISFANRAVQLFFVARNLKDEPETFIEVMDFVGDDDTVLQFIAGLSDEIGPWIEALIKRGRLMHAAMVASYAKTPNDALADYVASEMQRGLTRQFLARLSGERADVPEVVQTEEQPSADRHATLLDLLDLARDETARNHVRGARFEAFAEALFEPCFRRVRRNAVTHHGELDIIMENVGEGAFWNEFGGDVLVECKNMGRGAPSKEVHAFISKVETARGKLAFFVSFNGFTRPAKTLLLSTATNAAKPLIVPLAGEDIRRALTRREDLEQYIKDEIRRVRYQLR